MWLSLMPHPTPNSLCSTNLACPHLLTLGIGHPFLDMESHKSLLETVAVHTHKFLAVPSYIGSLNLMEKAKRSSEWWPHAICFPP